jgi:transcriptional regulator with XRE-family HTH domain
MNQPYVRGDLVRRIRLALSMSRPDFGALIGVSQHAIKRLEIGQLRMSTKMAKRLCTIHDTRAREDVGYLTAIYESYAAHCEERDRRARLAKDIKEWIARM